MVANEVNIVWLEEPGNYEYVRVSEFTSRTRMGMPLSIQKEYYRVVGYAELAN